MKKRLLSILLMCCMVLTLLPTTAFAEESTETPPVCTCETACAAEAMNTECPVCGAVGALPESCAKCSGPVEDAAAEPEVEDNEAQPEASPVVLSGKREIKSEAELNVALGDKSCTEITLGENIELSGGYIISHTVTLDLNGYTLTVNGNELDIFSVYESGNLTVKDSGTGGKIDGQNKNCGFCIYGGVLTLESGTIINCMTDGDGSAVDISSGDSEGVYGKFVMNGGAITNCKATDDGGAVDIGKGCTFIMNSGTISGCRADDDAGAIFIKGNASFEMKGGTIENCSAGFCGGAVKIRNTSSFTMTGGTISNCTAQQGGGVYVDDSSTFNMNGGSIANCTAVNGGNSVFVMSGTGGKFTMTDGTVDGSVTLHYTVAGSDVYMDGLGTATYPYQISTAAQLKLFRDIVNGTDVQTPNSGACAVLMNDIVLNDGTFDANGNYTPTTGLIGANPEEWTPIGKYTDDGNNNTPYTGTFDGGGHTIKGLYVNLSDVAVGLFGCLEDAAVRNLTVDGYVQGRNIVGGIAGKARAYSTAPSTVENCRNDCHVVCEYGTGSGSFLYIGGIVGSAADTTIAGCVNTGVVEAKGSNNYSSVAAGIVGSQYENVTVKNCYNTGEINVTGDKLRAGTAGGIAGSDFSEGSTISDCYNLGAVTVSYTGSRSDYTAEVGGIMGYISTSATTVSNCYSVGALTSTTGTGTSYIGGVVGSNAYNNTVENCYYLDSTATKAVGNGGGIVDEATGPKTAAQLGDGTVVLKLLINNRTDSEHPWNSQCQYLAAAGKTLPVFKTQTGDAHRHDWSAWTSNGDGTHSRRCTCNAVETVNCSGGKATCKDKAVCEFCKASYGSLDPNNHTDLKHIDAKAATAAAEGNIEYWYCEDCNKYFSDADAKNVITQAQTVIPKRQSSGGGSGGSSSYPITVPSKTENGTVTVSPKNASAGSTVTITVKPDSGYVLETISVTDKNGNDLKLTDKSNGKYTFTMPTSKVEIKVTFMEDNSVLNFFYDVPNDAYYYEAVKWAAENGITGGVGNSLFAPNQPCTRAQIVTFIWRAAGSPAPKSMSSFTDVPADAFYAKAVAWAVENGITSGTGEGKFSPNAICTRAQSVTFLYRTSGSPAVSGSAEFSDVSTTAFYADAVAWAATKGITTGIGGGLFGSDNDCTRSQIVTFLWRCKK